jgi:hypothetical protein
MASVSTRSGPHPRHFSRAWGTGDPACGDETFLLRPHFLSHVLLMLHTHTTFQTETLSRFRSHGEQSTPLSPEQISPCRPFEFQDEGSYVEDGGGGGQARSMWVVARGDGSAVATSDGGLVLMVTAATGVEVNVEGLYGGFIIGGDRGVQGRWRTGSGLTVK